MGCGGWFLWSYFMSQNRYVSNCFLKQMSILLDIVNVNIFCLVRYCSLILMHIKLFSVQALMIWQCASDQCRKANHCVLVNVTNVYCVLSLLTLTLPNFLNRIIHLPFLALSANSIGKIAWICGLAWLCIYLWQRLITFGSGRIRVKWPIVYSYIKYFKLWERLYKNRFSKCYLNMNRIYHLLEK